jgi:hypothetical protein
VEKTIYNPPGWSGTDVWWKVEADELLAEVKAQESSRARAAIELPDHLYTEGEMQDLREQLEAVQRERDALEQRLADYKAGRL